jgi:hypothetical protein
MDSDERHDSLPPVPGWIRVVDAATFAVVAILFWKVLSADTRAGIFGFIPRISTPALIYGGLGLLALRHIVFPRPSAAARVTRAWRRVRERPHFGPAVGAFLGTRVFVFVVGIFSIAAFGLHRPGVVLTADPLMNLPMRFDAGWYGGIAMHGYDRNVNFERQRNIAFFPAMPMLMRAVGPIFGSSRSGLPPERRMVRILWAGVAVSLAAFLLALFYFVKLAAQLLGPERAAGAALLLAAYPFACFFNAPYTESLFLLTSVAAAYHFGRAEWVYAAAWGFLAGLTRPNGFFLSVPLGLLALQQLLSRMKAESTREWLESLKAVAAAAMPVAGMLAFTAYLYALTGVWFAWSRSHEAWGRSFTGLEPLRRGYWWLQEEGLVDVALASPFNMLNTLAAAFALLMIWPVARRLGGAWALYIVVILVPPMFAGGALSLGRMTSTLFPLFLALAAILPSRSVPSWAAAFAILQGLCAALFFTWRELF